MVFLNKTALKKQLLKKGIAVEGNYVRKSAIDKYLKNIIADHELDPTKDERYEEFEDLFLHGDCATFALALQKVLDYPISVAMYYGTYYGKNKKKGTLVHAVGMKGTTPVDFKGKHHTTFKNLTFD